MPIWKNINFQDSNSLIMENMLMFYDHTMLILMIILSYIFYMLIIMIFSKYVNRFLFNSQMIEIIWTIFPVLFLFFLALPSLNLLYITDEINNSSLSIKVLGNQWYWIYEYMDFLNLNIESYMINQHEINLFRLLDVDNRMILPILINIKFLVSSMDVIHSFTVPSLGFKIDGIPGRLNQISTMINRPGVYYGQCSEICGINHSFMPIMIESTKLNNFMSWIKMKIN